MLPCSNFERTFFFDSNCAAEKLFEERASKLFEPDDKPDNKRSCIQLYISPHSLEGFQHQLEQQPPVSEEIVTESTSDSEGDYLSFSALSGPRTRRSLSNSPRHFDASGLIHRDVSDIVILKDVAAVKNSLLVAIFVQLIK